MVSPIAIASGGKQAWIKISQTSHAAPVFGWVRGFGRVAPVADAGVGQSLFTRPLAASRSQAYPVPKRCRSIGGATSLRIEVPHYYVLIFLLSFLWLKLVRGEVPDVLSTPEIIMSSFAFPWKYESCLLLFNLRALGLSNDWFVAHNGLSYSCKCIS